ncbi:MAG TPA: PLP-dependent aminotransferase family protein [Trichormus sp.]|jgi:GntR family transcriptional regulator/MocR family aminotransferase
MQFTVPIDFSSPTAVYKQISAGIRDAILSRRISTGDRLPSTRELAQALGLNRLTVVKSYDELHSEGYIETIVGAGTFVSQNVAGAGGMSFQPPAAAPHGGMATCMSNIELSSFGERLMSSSVEQAPPDVVPELNYGAPRLDELPLERWQFLLNRATRLARAKLLHYTNDSMGFLPLREAIAKHLRRARCGNCTADQVIVFSQPDADTDLLCRLLIDPGDCVGVEDPGFPGARRTLEIHGANVIGIPVDSQGLIVEKLLERREPLKMLYLTPSHHDPTGVALSLSRRFELLNWAQSSNAVIIEDDYDSEYRYGEEPAQALQGLDTEGHVIYRYNFWKVLFPLVKLGFLVVPPNLVPLFKRARKVLDREMSLLEQHALAEFIAEGHFERHIRRTRNIYSARRAAVIQALTIHFGKTVTISKVSAGMHVLINFRIHRSDDYIMHCARQAGFPLASTRVNYMGQPVRGEFLAGFASIHEDDIRDCTRHFAELLHNTDQPAISTPTPLALTPGI